jgi:hypothetical protein
MNMGYEDDELKPYLEPEPDYRDHKRIGESASMYITLTTYRLYVKCRTRYEYSVLTCELSVRNIGFRFPGYTYLKMS